VLLDFIVVKQPGKANVLDFSIIQIDRFPGGRRNPGHDSQHTDAVREQAMKQIRELGPRAEAALRKAGNGKLSMEQQQRIDSVLPDRISRLGSSESTLNFPSKTQIHRDRQLLSDPTCSL
jgi:hypothetical protein